METLPDAPWIREAERYGVETAPEVHCPVCGADCETVYLDRYGDVVGCENCVREMDAGDWRRCYED